MSALQSQDIIEYLYSLGHFHNPDAETGITEGDLPSLTLADPEVVTAVKSFQSFSRATLEQITAEETGVVRARVDGEVGPATEKLLTMERCGCPDYPVPGSEYAAMVERAGNNQSWPHSCDPNKPQIHSIKVKIYKNRMPRFLEPHFESRVWPLVIKAYRDIGVDFVRTEGTPNIDFSWENLQGSTIGLAIVPGGPQRCNSRIWARFDPGYHPRDVINQWARLVAHELGHNMRLGHTNGGIMNPSILSGEFSEREWRKDPSFRTLARYFGGEPIDPPSDPDPEPPTPEPPSGNGFYLSGTVTIKQGDQELGDFQLVPKARM